MTAPRGELAVSYAEARWLCDVGHEGCHGEGCHGEGPFDISEPERPGTTPILADELRIWFSPGCLRPDRPKQRGLFDDGQEVLPLAGGGA